jgi:hypothetical protein
MKLRVETKAQAALTMIEVLVLVVGFAVLFFFVLPALFPHRSGCIRPSCVSNIREIGTAFRLWADDNNGFFPMHYVGNPNYPQLRPATSWLGRTLDYADAYVYFQAMSNELSAPKLVICPADTRTIASNFPSLQWSNVSYFAGQDADSAHERMFLCGDRNIIVNSNLASPGLVSIYPTDAVGWSRKIHNESGCVTLADGSAQKFSSAQLQKAIGNMGTNMNRLVFP